MSASRVGDNIAYLVAIKAATRAALAEAMDVSVQAIGQLIRGETKELKPSNVARAAKYLGLTSDDLILRDLRREGWSPDFVVETKDGHKAFIEIKARATQDSDLIYLPVLSLPGSAGPGIEDEELSIVGGLAWKRSWIRKNGWEPRQLFVSPVKGMSMAHWMPDGNRAVIHRGDNVIKETDDPYENVFALMDGPAFRFKKLIPQSDGSIVLHSFNEDKKQYPDERRSEQELDSLHIIGRVVCRVG